MNPDRSLSIAQNTQIEGPVLERTLEFKTFRFPFESRATIDLPPSPGTVRRDASGRALLLHFAPGRFLAPAPTPDMERHLDALQAAGVGALFDVDGKCQAFTIRGQGAENLLSYSINLTQVLGNRDCAAVHLFDCPAVLARGAEAFDVWVERSYATEFRECLDDLRRMAREIRID
jgi:heterotetrameric sarcosine oxidase gamma subunit